MADNMSIKLTKDNYIKLGKIASKSGLSLSSALNRVVIAFTRNKNNKIEFLDYDSDCGFTRFCWCYIDESKNVVIKLSRKYIKTYSDMINIILFNSRAKYVIARENRSSFNKSKMSINRRIKKFNSINNELKRKKTVLDRVYKDYGL